MQQNKFRTASIKVYGISLPWHEMQSKLKYVAWCEESDMGAEMTYFRVYAYKVNAMRMSEWRKMFEGMSVCVERIHGRLCANQDYAACLMNGQLSEWGVRPYPAYYLCNPTGHSDDDDFISVNDDSESEVAPILDEAYKMKISFICCADDTNQPIDWAATFKKK